MRCLSAWVATLLLLLAICGTASSTGPSPMTVADMVNAARQNIQAAAARPRRALANLRKDYNILNDWRQADWESFEEAAWISEYDDVKNHRTFIQEDLAQVRPGDSDVAKLAEDHYDLAAKELARQTGRNEAHKIARASWKPINSLLNDFAFSRLDYVQFSYILAREARRLNLIRDDLYNEAILEAARQAAAEWIVKRHRERLVTRTIPATRDAMENPKYKLYNTFRALVTRFSHKYEAEVKELASTPGSHPQALPPRFLELKAHLGRYAHPDQYLAAIERELETGQIKQAVHDPYDLSKNRDIHGNPADYVLEPRKAKDLFDHPGDVEATMFPARQPGPVFRTALQGDPSRVQGSKQSAMQEDGWHFDTAHNHEIRDAFASLTWSRQHRDSARGKASTSSYAAQYPTEPADPLHQQQMDAYGGHPSTSSTPTPVKYRDNDMDFDLNTVPRHGSPFGTGAAPIHVKEEPEHGYVHVKEEPEHGYVHVKEEPEHGYGYPVAGSSYPYSGAAHSDTTMYVAGSGTSGSKRSSGNRMQGSTSNAGFNWPADGYGEQYHYGPYAGQPYPAPGYYNPHARGY